MGRKKLNVEVTEDGATITGSTNSYLKALQGNTEDKPIVITGAALKYLFCHYSYDHTIAPGIINSVRIKSELPVHDDLREKFKFLSPHLAAICEELDDEAMEYFTEHNNLFSFTEKGKNFSVSAFKIVGSVHNQGVVLIGEKQLTTGEFVRLETPVVKWDGEYQLINELRISIDDCISEVEQYVKGKQAPAYVQTEMFEEKEEAI